MAETITLFLGVLALLAVPGPTNTLLAASGIAGGWRRSALLVPAEMAGYTISVSLLLITLGPLLRGHHTLELVSKIVCCLYIARLACKLWNKGQSLHPDHPAVVSPRQLFTTTLLNPKGIFLALALLPHASLDQWDVLLLHAGIVLGLIAVAGSGWVTIGSIIHARLESPPSPRILNRCCAGAMGMFATILALHVISSW